MDGYECDIGEYLEGDLILQQSNLRVRVIQEWSIYREWNGD